MKHFSASDWKILKFHKDKTGYEWCINDLSVNDFIPKKIEQEGQKNMLSIAMNVLEVWGNKLKKIFPNRKFVYIYQLQKIHSFKFTFPYLPGRNWIHMGKRDKWH